MYQCLEPSPALTYWGYPESFQSDIVEEKPFPDTLNKLALSGALYQYDGWYGSCSNMQDVKHLPQEADSSRGFDPNSGLQNWRDLASEPDTLDSIGSAYTDGSSGGTSPKSWYGSPVTTEDFSMVSEPYSKSVSHCSHVSSCGSWETSPSMSNAVHDKIASYTALCGGNTWALGQEDFGDVFGMPVEEELSMGEGYDRIHVQYSRRQTIKLEDDTPGTSLITQLALHSSGSDNSYDELPSDDEQPDDDDSDEYLPGQSSKSSNTRRKKSGGDVLSSRARANRITKTRTSISSRHMYRTSTASKLTSSSNTETRTFRCVFHWAGCNSTFGAKNEWKRHVATQHLKLCNWVCTLGACGQKAGGSHTKKADSVFNRKDLFTSHIRRMHMPPKVTSASKQVQTKWEQDHQAHARQERRKPCNKSRCPVGSCGERFAGEKGWDERMEHIAAKHLDDNRSLSIDQGEGGIKEWALKIGLVAREGSGWRLVDQSASASNLDAEGDDEL